jgi:hypothetical protein
MVTSRQQLQQQQIQDERRTTTPLRRLNGPAPRANFAFDLDTARMVDEFKPLAKRRYRGEAVKRAIEVATKFLRAQQEGKTIKIDDTVVELL